MELTCSLCRVYSTWQSVVSNVNDRKTVSFDTVMMGIDCWYVWITKGDDEHSGTSDIFLDRVSPFFLWERERDADQVI